MYSALPADRPLPATRPLAAKDTITTPRSVSANFSPAENVLRAQSGFSQQQQHSHPRKLCRRRRTCYATLRTVPCLLCLERALLRQALDCCEKWLAAALPRPSRVLLLTQEGRLRS